PAHRDDVRRLRNGNVRREPTDFAAIATPRGHTCSLFAVHESRGVSTNRAQRWHSRRGGMRGAAARTDESKRRADDACTSASVRRLDAAGDPWLATEVALCAFRGACG